MMRPIKIFLAAPALTWTMLLIIIALEMGAGLLVLAPALKDD